MQSTGDYIDVVKQGLLFFKRGDDDGYDRISSRITVGALFFLAAYFLMETMTKDPMDCFSPVEFSEQWTKYADNICWIQNTYLHMLNFGEAETSTVREIAYYQWVPIILLIQAMFFAAPGYFWAWATEFSGYDVKMLSRNDKDDEDVILSEELQDYIVNRVLISTTPLNPPPKKKNRHLFTSNPSLHFGRYLTIAYFITKLLYLANAIFQFFVLNFLLGDGFSMYGYDSLRAWLSGREDLAGSEMFPKVTACQFHIRTLGAAYTQRYTVQCLLPRNMFYEKTFIFIWWWLAVVATLTAIGLLSWIMRCAIPHSKSKFVWKYLKSKRIVTPSDKALVQQFANSGLRSDGVFCLRIVHRNTNDLAVANIIAAIWEKWNAQSTETDS